MRGFKDVKGFEHHMKAQGSTGKLTKNVLNTVVAVEALSILPRVI